MFDFARISDTVSGLLGNTVAQNALQSQPVQDLLERAGITPDMLAGLDQAQIMDVLAQHGIDPTQLSADKLSELANSLGLPEQFSAAATGWFGGGGSRS